MGRVRRLAAAAEAAGRSPLLGIQAPHLTPEAAGSVDAHKFINEIFAVRV